MIMSMNPEPTESPETNPPVRQLFRPREGGLLTGTAAGIASHLGMDPTIVRVLFVLLAVMGGAGVPLYLAAWLLIPEQGAEQSIGADLIEHARLSLHGAA